MGYGLFILLTYPGLKMALLLHLSDLHLATEDDNDVVADRKEDVIDLGHQQTRLSILKHSLTALGDSLLKTGEELDSILISGDITVRGQQEGFDLLDSVLECLGEAKPDAERILIIPGNHDVERYTPASSRERYEHFLRLRGEPYKTAFLEGIDIDANGKRLATDTDPVIVARDESFVLIGLNSSNHCGSERAAEAYLKPHLDSLKKLEITDPSVASLFKAWKARGLADIARLDANQLIAARVRLNSALKGVTAHTPLRMVALHHQVQPVTVTEEIKSYDPILNLGEFRDWLVSNSIDVVLHGHKHEGKVLADRHMPLNEAENGQVAHDMLVISAPTIQVGQNGRDAIGYLIDVRGPSARIAGVKIAEVPSLSAGVALDIQKLAWHPYEIDQLSAHGVIEGDTVDEVHAKLLAIQDRLENVKLPLICRIKDGTSAHMIPSTFASLPESFGERQEWFTRMVHWWQNRHDLKSTKFTHGQRLFADGNGSRPSQITSAINALKDKPETSRAVAILMEPQSDLADKDSEFPAFILVQFTIRKSRLNVTAYFRKQEMPHWWPINVGELASLQDYVISEVSAKRPTTPGSITTVTALPTAGSAIPRVAVPLLDQKAEDYAGLLDLVLPLYRIGSAEPDDRSAWHSIFEDWRPGPSAAADGDRIPKVGFSALLQVIRAVGSTVGTRSKDVLDLCGVLEDLQDANTSYAQRQDRESAVGRGKWRNAVDRHIERLEGVLDNIFDVMEQEVHTTKS